MTLAPRYANAKHRVLSQRQSRIARASAQAPHTAALTAAAGVDGIEGEGHGKGGLCRKSGPDNHPPTEVAMLLFATDKRAP